MTNRRGQLTIFVIVAIVLVMVVLVYFFQSAPSLFSTGSTGFGFDDCVISVTGEVVNSLSLTGGIKSPEHYYLYQDNKVPYYCYTSSPYAMCIVQQPMILQTFEKELEGALLSKVNGCYEDSILELTERGYNVTSGKVKLNATIIPSKILLDISAPTTVSSKRFTDFKVGVDSEIYDVLMIATSIVSYETSYGDSSTSELMYYYPNLIVDKFKQGDSTSIYVISDKSSDLKFYFASRSLIWPAGYDIVERNLSGGVIR